MAQLVGILANLTDSAVAFIPNVVSAVILLAIGLVLGKVFGRVVKEVLDKVKLDYYVTETEKPVISMSGLFAVVIRWWIYLAFITAALSENVLGIPALASWIGGVTDFVPNIIGAAVIVVVGYILAEFIRGQMKKTGKIYASVVAKILFFFIIYVSIALALPILGISAVLVNNILIIIVASVGLGVAIALGLGLKDAVADLSKRWVKKVKI